VDKGIGVTSVISDERAFRVTSGGGNSIKGVAGRRNVSVYGGGIVTGPIESRNGG